MNELTYAKAALLGVVQGLTEFLPVSSSGHLALTQRMLGLQPDSKPMLLFVMLMHMGTLAAVAMVCRRSIRGFASRIGREWGLAFSGGVHLPPLRKYGTRIACLAIVATIPTGIIGLSFKGFFESTFNNMFWIGGGLLATGSLLLAASRCPRGKLRWKEFSFSQAFLIGIFQGLAILPGVSRSGTTISIATFLGLRRRWAAEFSFLIAFPAILGATLVQAKDCWDLPGVLQDLRWGPIFIGSVVSFFVGMAAVVLLVKAVRRAKLHYFTVYCWAAGATVLFFMR